MESFINSQIKELTKKYKNLQKDLLTSKINANQVKMKIDSIESFNKKSSKFKAALALTLALGVSSTVADLAVINKLNSKTYYKTDVAMISEDETFFLGSDFYPEFPGNERIDIVEYTSWKEVLDSSFLIFRDDYTPKYRRDIVVYEDVEKIKNGIGADYFDMDISDLNSEVKDTIYSYAPENLDEVKRLVIRYLQNTDDTTLVWDTDGANGLFYILLVLLPLLTGFGLYKSIKGLYELSKNKALREQLLKEIEELEKNIVLYDLKIEDIADSIVALYNKYEDVIQNEEVRNTAIKLIKERSEKDGY
jgi:hypothetical protein